MPLIIYWLFYLNQFNYFHIYGGAYFILFPFVIPLCLALAAKYLMRLIKWQRVTIFATYIAFMGLSLYLISGIFIKIKYASSVAWSLTWFIPIVYGIIATVALRKIIDEQDERVRKG